MILKSGFWVLAVQRAARALACQRGTSACISEGLSEEELTTRKCPPGQDLGVPRAWAGPQLPPNLLPPRGNRSGRLPLQDLDPPALTHAPSGISEHPLQTGQGVTQEGWDLPLPRELLSIEQTCPEKREVPAGGGS